MGTVVPVITVSGSPFRVTGKLQVSGWPSQVEGRPDSARQSLDVMIVLLRVGLRSRMRNREQLEQSLLTVAACCQAHCQAGLRRGRGPKIQSDSTTVAENQGQQSSQNKSANEHSFQCFPAVASSPAAAGITNTKGTPLASTPFSPSSSNPIPRPASYYRSSNTPCPAAPAERPCTRLVVRLPSSSTSPSSSTPVADAPAPAEPHWRTLRTRRHRPLPLAPPSGRCRPLPYIVPHGHHHDFEYGWWLVTARSG